MFAVLAVFCPGDVGAELGADPPAGCVCGLDDAGRERPIPGGCFSLQPPSGASRADKVRDLVQGDEVGDLTADLWHPDQEPTLASTAVELSPPTPAVGEIDPVDRAQRNDVFLETVRHYGWVNQPLRRIVSTRCPQPSQRP